jgi:hypothetical protein
LALQIGPPEVFVVLAVVVPLVVAVPLVVPWPPPPPLPPLPLPTVTDAHPPARPPAMAMSLSRLCQVIPGW